MSPLAATLADRLGCGPFATAERTPAGLVVAWQAAVPAPSAVEALRANAAARRESAGGPVLLPLVVSPETGRLARRLTLPAAALAPLASGRPWPDPLAGWRAAAAELRCGAPEDGAAGLRLGRSGLVTLAPDGPARLVTALVPGAVVRSLSRPVPPDVSEVVARVLLERAGATPDQFPALSGGGPGLGGLVRVAALFGPPDVRPLRAAAARLLAEVREDRRVVEAVLDGAAAVLGDGEELADGDDHGGVSAGR
jgi:hypothetical protein